MTGRSMGKLDFRNHNMTKRAIIKSKRVSVHFSRHKKQGKLHNIRQYLLMANQYEDEANDHGNDSDIDKTDGN